MENISRRRALALLPAAGATTVAHAAALAVETPEVRANRLQRELSDALYEAWGGRFGAEVFPSNVVPHDWGGKFFDIASHRQQWREGRDALYYVDTIRHGAPWERARLHAEGLEAVLPDIRPGRYRQRLDFTDDPGVPFVSFWRVGEAQS